jgi:hypothetical protein
VHTVTVGGLIGCKPALTDANRVVPFCRLRDSMTFTQPIGRWLLVTKNRPLAFGGWWKLVQYGAAGEMGRLTRAALWKWLA